MLGGCGLEDLINVILKTNVQHLIGLVQHQEGQLVELEVATVEVVDNAAGRAYDDVDAALQRALLRPVHRPTVYAEAGVLGHHDLELCADLLRQLSRGQQAEHPWSATWRLGLAAGVGAQHLLHDGQHEGEGLALAGLCSPDDVLPGDHFLVRLSLDREERVDAALLEDRHGLRQHVEHGQRRAPGRLVHDLCRGALDALACDGLVQLERRCPLDSLRLFGGCLIIGGGRELRQLG
mmetsp:Transcript_13532/g.35792  ORF Transcript_13532/g.35792 Transcript_13532/m.35792 type:complete len:236 (-) Transcript_13532:263-970(-)